MSCLYCCTNICFESFLVSDVLLYSWAFDLILFFFCPSDLLCAWWLVSLNPDTGSDPNHWQKTGSSPWWAHVWPPMVGPWRYKRISNPFKHCHVNLHTECLKRLYLARWRTSCSGFVWSWKTWHVTSFHKYTNTVQWVLVLIKVYARTPNEQSYFV